MNPDEYKQVLLCWKEWVLHKYWQVLTTMKNCILATELALFFPNKARLANIVKENVFDWEHPDHRWIMVLAIITNFLSCIRMLAMALCMTGSDLNSSSKPWEVQFRTSKIVYAEFHEQVIYRVFSLHSYEKKIHSGRCGKGSWMETYSTVW